MTFPPEVSPLDLRRIQKPKGKRKKQMNKMIKMAAIAVGAAAMFAGCGAKTPDSVAKEVVACLEKADFDGMSKYATGDFKKVLGMLKGMMDGAEQNDIDDAKKEFKGPYELGAATVNGDKATVPCKVKGKDKPIKLVKVDGKWLVEDFNFKNM